MTVTDETPMTDDVFASQTEDETVEDAPGAIAKVDDAEIEAESEDKDEDDFEEEPWDAGDKDWKHDFIEFYGDRLAVRKPTQQALSAFGFATSKFVPARVQLNALGLFMVNHLSEASYDRVQQRMLDPDDSTYDKKAVAKLLGDIARLGRAADDEAAKKRIAAKSRS